MRKFEITVKRKITEDLIRTIIDDAVLIDQSQDGYTKFWGFIAKESGHDGIIMEYKSEKFKDLNKKDFIVIDENLTCSV